MSEKPPVMESSRAAKRFGKFAAVFSILAPVAAILWCFFLFEYMTAHGHAAILTIEELGLISVGLILAGLCLGILGAVMIRRKEHRGLFGTALAGICLNALLLASLVIVPLLIPFMMGHKYPTTASGRLKAATNELAAATSNEDKFYALDDAAKESFNVGNTNDAGQFARELLKLAPQFKGNWNYGNAIQDGNLVLGRIAVREGNIEAAKQYLLAAGKSPGSPQMDSFGPNMSLAKDLLKTGQRDVVLQYFELCRKFWDMDYGKLDQWSKEVKAGKMPDFGANLVY